MSLILELASAGNDPIHKSCALLFFLYCLERGIKTNSGVEYAKVLNTRYQGWNLKILPQKPNSSPGGVGAIYKEDGTYKLAGRGVGGVAFLFNVALFCIRSLLSEIRPQHVDRYGSVPTDSENCDTGLTTKRLENLFQVTERAITLELIPKDSTPETYIRMLMKFYDDILNSISPNEIDIQSQTACVLYFYRNSMPGDTSTGIKVEAVDNYEFYSNNIVPFYLNPEKDPFLSPYNYDAYYDDDSDNAYYDDSENAYYKKWDYSLDKDNVRYRHILRNFSYMKRMRMIFGYVCKSKGDKHVSTQHVNNEMTLNEDYTKVSFELGDGQNVDLIGICENCRKAAKEGNIWNFILPNHYLSFYHRNDYYRILANQQNWKNDGVDSLSLGTNYSIDGREDCSDVILNLWQSGLYKILEAVIKSSNKDLFEGSVLSEVNFSTAEKFTLLDKIYRDAGITLA